MPVPVACACGWAAMVPDEHAGRLGTCPKCKARVRVTSPAPTPAASAPKPAAGPTAPPVRRRAKRGGPTISHRLTYVAGVTFANPDGSDRQAIIRKLREGDPLALVREPENPHGNGNTVAVRRADGEQVGYVPSWMADRIAPEMDAGVPHYGYVAGVAKGKHLGKPSRGVDLLIVVDHAGMGRKAVAAYARAAIDDPEIDPAKLAPKRSGVPGCLRVGCLAFLAIWAVGFVLSLLGGGGRDGGRAASRRAASPPRQERGPEVVDGPRDPSRLADTAGYVRDRLAELDSFRSEEYFRSHGFGGDGRYSPWLESVTARHRENRRYGLFDEEGPTVPEKSAVGELRSLGMSYAFSLGEETEETRRTRASILDSLREAEARE